ncbi:MAG: alpha/beta hydrolase-fold protein [Pseudohongiella sp.]|nr:alpha/beta hydrolase-fold protein [Pseudohongiella sp.]
MKIKISQAVLALVVFVITLHAHARPSGTPVTIGEQLTIASGVLGEERTIIVGLPAAYDLDDSHYPVLFVLDGSDHFHYTTGITEFLGANQFIPEMIVVAINNTDRNRDLTPPSQDPMDQQFLPTHGGADNFQRFFAEDLIPWVEQHYRAHPYRVLIGHSFGGLFAIHTLTTRPDLFNAYIAISPSLQWNGQRLVEQAEQFFSETPQLPVSLYMTVGDEGGQLLGGTRKLAGVLDSAAPRDFLWQFDHMPRETHNSVPHRSTYQGLEFVFANWILRNPEQIYKQYGLAAIEQFHAFGDERYGTNRGIPAMTFGYLLGGMRREGNLDDAVRLMSHPSAMDNAASSMHSFVGDALREKENQEQSVRFYRQALQLNPGNLDARGALDTMGLDFSDIVPQLQADARILQRYAGVYATPLTSDITILIDDGKLYRELDGNRNQLLPLSESEFYMLGADVRYRFQNAGDDAVVWIQIRSENTQFLAERR